jgi:3-deoxy-D-manno-octulosonic-acid transferase
MISAMILGIYRAAWEPLLWAVRLGAALERVAGGRLWPARWRLADRLGAGSRPHGNPGRPAIWLHAASLGECKGLWAFARTLGDRDADIVLTANTTAGLDFLRKQAGRDAEPARWTARLAPLDHPRVVAHFLRAHGIRALILFEVELWPHWIFAARRANVPVLWISARLTQKARRRYAGTPLFAAALRRVLEGIAWTQAQTPAEAEILRGLGCASVEAGGDLRGLHYLGEAGAGSGAADRGIPWGARSGIAFVSIHAGELPALVPQIAAAGTETPLTIFPRRMEELPEFVKALAPQGFALHSQRPGSAHLLVDAFGLVGETLAHCRLAVIGGSFIPDDTIGGHNLWEPLVAGTRIVIGPHHGNQEYLARRLADGGLLRIASVQDEAADRMMDQMSDEAAADPAEARLAFIAKERAALARAAACARQRLSQALFPA